MEKDKGIFIPMIIWKIKNLNINEKLVLSDIFNKRELTNFSGYNKSIRTLFDEMLLFESNVKEIFKTLNKKGYIFSNPTYYRNKGEIKKVLANRDINIEALNNAERFTIPDDNIFYKDSKQGVFIPFDDIIKINGYSREGKGKSYKAKNRDRFLILYLLIIKIGFYNTQYFNTRINPIFVRFKINDLVEFTGMSYKTVLEYIKSLTRYYYYNKDPYKILYNLGKKEDYELLVNDFNIKPFQKCTGKEIAINDGWDIKELWTDTDRTLYFINTEALKEIGILFNIDNKFNKAVEKL